MFLYANFFNRANRMYIELGLQIILSKSRSEKLTLKPGYFCHNLCVTPSCHLSDKRNRENAILRSKEKVSWWGEVSDTNLLQFTSWPFDVTNLTKITQIESYLFLKAFIIYSGIISGKIFAQPHTTLRIQFLDKENSSKNNRLLS